MIVLPVSEVYANPNAEVQAGNFVPDTIIKNRIYYGKKNRRIKIKLSSDETLKGTLVGVTENAETVFTDLPLSNSRDTISVSRDRIQKIIVTKKNRFLRGFLWNALISESAALIFIATGNDPWGISLIFFPAVGITPVMALTYLSRRTYDLVADAAAFSRFKQEYITGTYYNKTKSLPD